MKTLIQNTTNVSKYLFEDSINISIESDKIMAPDFIISDLNSNNATLVEGVTAPEDWTGCKYLYENSAWVVNPNWVEPEPFVDPADV